MRRLAYILSIAGAIFVVVPLAGQNVAPPAAPGMDLAGYWNNVFHQDPCLGTGGVMLVDYGGIPINEAARMYALSWDA